MERWCRLEGKGEVCARELKMGAMEDGGLGDGEGGCRGSRRMSDVGEV